MVRTLFPTQFQTPWTFVKKGRKGLHKVGPYVWEKNKWPGQNREFPELSPKFQKNNHESLRGYTGVYPTGYVDQKTGKFVQVRGMVPELVVPDLSSVDLKPYVSYRTDVTIKERLERYERQLQKYDGDEEKVMATLNPSEIWPPPAVDARLLFDYFYADRIRESYGLKPKKRRIEKKDSWIEKLRGE